MGVIKEIRDLTNEEKSKLLTLGIPNDYNVLFNAISDAVKIEGRAISISVTKFRQSIMNAQSE